MIKVNYFFHDNEWDVDKLKVVLPAVIINEILKVPISCTQENLAYWALTLNGDFTTKSAWELLRQRQLIHALGKFIWHTSIPLTVSFFLWCLVHNWIPVELRMKSKGFQLASKCLCCQSKETIMHVLWEGPIAQQVWNYFAKFFQIYVERNDAKHRGLGMYPDRNAAGGGILRDHIGVFWSFIPKISKSSKNIVLFYKVGLDTRYLLASIRKCLSCISFRISHIHREGNQAADHLSVQGYTHQNLHVFSQAKVELKGILRLDKLNLPYVRF
ncbi:Uncharacterized protein TCM_036655 [Theobroma cacao]|uniref:Reverse transcriptase zinc-binding domain-containing protein n=1 Tax=Theobroma cacao TaxID=3641 RepID=A0A061FJE4_THECC|nr:Uncharacterized protein TCM_036655 [Theobroma cacao]